MIGGMHAVGVGEVGLQADATYRPTNRNFNYQVSDRISGWGRMTASWELSSGRRGELGEMRSLFLPLGRSFGAAPASIILFLDSAAPQPPVTIPLRRDQLQILSDGAFNAIRLVKNDTPTLPDLAGSRSFRYSLIGKDGAQMAGDIFLLPDWKKLRGRIGSGVRTVESMLRKKDCDPFYVIGTR